MNRANHITQCDAASIAAMVTNGEASALEVDEAALNRVAALDPQLHAFGTLIPEQARVAAVKLDQLRSAGGNLGPLASVPVAIKDLISTKGIQTTYCSKAYENLVPVDDDVIIERLVAAGAIILGKTNASEFGYGAVGHNSVFATTRNLWNLDLTSGGSSAGSAVAIDWVAVCREDGTGLRIGYSPAFEAIDVDPDAASVVAAAVATFETCIGGTIELVKCDFDAFAWAFLGIVMLESDLTGMRELAKRQRGEQSVYLVELLSRQWTAEELSRAVVARKAVANKMWQLMRNFDLFITPTVATPAFPIDLMAPSTVNGKKRAVEDWAPFNWPMNCTGQPAMSVPAGFTPSGLPVGIQIAGRQLDDAGVFGAAAVFERVRPSRHHWPGIVGNTTAATLSPTPGVPGP